jgi:tRNA threonylcarbamoyladenosine biosynthesis protein TsaE
MEQIYIKDLKTTKEFASKFAKMLKGGEIILLNGDLGAGKTTFTRYVLQFLGVKDNVASPTFTIMREYKTKTFNILHFDMYRISSSDEAIAFGMDEFIYNIDKNKILFIEWSENVKDILPQKCINVDIKLVNDNERMFIVKGLLGD